MAWAINKTTNVEEGLYLEFLPLRLNNKAEKSTLSTETFMTRTESRSEMTCHSARFLFTNKRNSKYFGKLLSTKMFQRSIIIGIKFTTKTFITLICL